MGCLQSSEAAHSKKAEARYRVDNPATGSQHSRANPGESQRKPAQPEQPKQPVLDEALAELYDAVHLLGAGGTGESWLVKDRETGEYLAIKLIKRPIPTVLQPMMLREIEVFFFVLGGILDFES